MLNPLDAVEQVYPPVSSDGAHLFVSSSPARVSRAICLRSQGGLSSSGASAAVAYHYKRANGQVRPNLFKTGSGPWEGCIKL